jgi:hypothetical protein
MPETLHPSFAGLCSYATEQLPEDSDLATARTIEVMIAYIREDAGTPAIAAALIQAAPAYARSGACEWTVLQHVFDWIRSKVRFATDARTAADMTDRPAQPHEIELLIRPVDLLRMERPTGDCDDFSMLTAAMLLAAGIRCELVTIAADAEQPDAFSHVYVEAVLPSGRVPLDTSHGRYLGWEYPAPARKQTWPITGDETTMRSAGLGNAGTMDLAHWGAMMGADSQQSTGSRILENVIGGTMRVFERRYGTPPPGTYEQNGDQVYYRQQPGSGPLNFPTVGLTGSGTTSLLLMGVVAVAVLFAITRR